MILQTETAGACWARLLAALLVTSRAAAEAGAPSGSGQPKPRAAQFVPSFGPPAQQPVFEFYHEPQHYTRWWLLQGQAFGDSFAPSPPDPLLNALQATAAPHSELQSNVPERLQLSAQPQDLSQLLPASLYAASPLYKALDKTAPLEVTEAPITIQTPQPPQSSLHNPHSFHSVVNYGVISVHHGDHFEPHNNGVAEPDRHHTSSAEQRSAPRLGQSTSDAVALSLQPPPAPAAPPAAQRPPDAETVSPEPADAEPK
ncbi:uncharacterized protein LOC126419038 isoform X1 [Schistocerca serialis cubense]|uniref:uncharacterized protein LOC126419038 isoform X1 n=1 Tax=Schistocerca serialis cubense TaxID=2023355 RepID=UPI00214E2B0B|nr:uncharacterized protein LOC126419038 isoform X1 [Schistocerca serialis cubense]